MTATRWRALVVDDEPPARALLTDHVRECDDLDLVGECADADEAVRAIRHLRPDVVFLDIQMPGGSGFDVIDEVGVDAMPLVVFVTAFDEYAVRAFRAHAFDYLLKPLQSDEFSDTVRRAVRRLGADGSNVGGNDPGDLTTRLDRLLAALARDRSGDERITVWEGGRAVILLTANIDRADVDANYVQLSVGAARYALRTSMAALEARLPSAQFVRLNRSTVVNIDFVREIQTYFHGDFAVVLKDGSSVITGRTYRERLRQRFRG